MAMLSANTILVPTDYSTSAEIARAHALFLARQTQGHVHELHILEGATSTAPTVVHTEQERIRTDCTTWGVDVTSYMQEGRSPAAHIIEHIRLHSIDLVVMGARGQTGYRDYLSWGADLLHLGHTAEQVVRMAPCPVLTLGPRGKRQPGEVKRILVPVDLGANTTPVMRASQQWAAAYGAEVVVMHVQPVSEENTHVLAQGDGYVEGPAQILATLQALWETAGSSQGDVRFEVCKGQARKVIVQAAMQHDIQMVVLCRSTPSTTLEEALGSVAYQVASVIPCPVLMLPPIGDIVRLHTPAAANGQTYSDHTM